MITSAGTNKRAGAGTGVPEGRQRAPSAPRESVSFLPSSLHQPFATPCHHREAGQCGELRGVPDWHLNSEDSLELLADVSACTLQPGSHAPRFSL